VVGMRERGRDDLGEDVYSLFVLISALWKPVERC
jgi:hypothetical protein